MTIRNRLILSVMTAFLAVLGAVVFLGYLVRHDAMAALLGESFFIILTVGVIIMAATTLLISEGISRPITQIANAAERLADGNLSSKFPKTDACDEISRLELSLTEMTESMLRTVDELRREKGLFQVAFSQMRDGFVILNTNWKTIECNKAAEKLLMLSSKRNMLEHLFEHFDCSCPRPAIENAGKNAVRFKLTRKELGSASKLILSCSVAPIFDSGYRLIERVMNVNDVTRQEGEDIAKENFLSLMSHKFMTPVTVLEGKMHLMLDGLMGPLEDRQRENLVTMMEQSNKLKRLVDTLLNFIRMEESNLDHSRERLNVADFMKDVVQKYESRYRSRNAHITVLVSKDMETIEFNRKYLHILVSELIDNGLKFNTRDPAKISVEFTLANGRPVIKISDNGIGIPPEASERIFDRFHQVEKYFTGNVGGAGLGLTYVRKIADAFALGIHIDSLPDHGSTFTISF